MSSRMAPVCPLRLDKPRDRLVADQHGDQSENDGRRKSGKVPQLAGAEGKTRIMRMAACVPVGKRRQQQRTCMSRHMQAVGDKGQ